MNEGVNPMRGFLAGFLVLFSLSFGLLAVTSVSFAEEACRCKGCGCKGGPGWRGPDGFCVSKAKLAMVCGTPAAAPCKQESAARVCFGSPDGAAASAGSVTQ
jgi:hypothetical protein